MRCACVACELRIAAFATMRVFMRLLRVYAACVYAAFYAACLCCVLCCVSVLRVCAACVYQ